MPENMDTLAEFENLNQKDIKDLDSWIESSIVVEPSHTEKMFKGQLYFLTGDGISSATEHMAEFCKHTGFATLVGFNTSGDGGGGTPDMKMLPNSGLVFRYRTTYALNSDGSCNVEFGTKPDIKSEAGEEPLDTCIKFIAKEKEK